MGIRGLMIYLCTLYNVTVVPGVFISCIMLRLPVIELTASYLCLFCVHLIQGFSLIEKFSVAS